MVMYKFIQPTLKWVGGKRQLLPQIEEYFPKDFSRYYEPFVGGGAVLFYFKPDNAVVNDTNPELINYYKVVKHNVEGLIEELKKDKYANDKASFYKIRELDRNDNYDSLSDIEKAARIQFLNKTCFNGLYRVNSKGEFNTPFGSYKNPNYINEEVLRAVSYYFNSIDIEILNVDFEQALKCIQNTDFVYFDPPYDPISESANFTGYAKNGFNKDDQLRLRDLCDKLDEQGVRFLLSNSSTEFIYKIYNKYEIIPVYARRNINSDASKRGDIKEVLVKNYD
ncbi:MAG: DNA adenine methylase [Tissierellia bacterium]|nr:DNA adenine methylase [Tissierellia bacterium]